MLLSEALSQHSASEDQDPGDLMFDSSLTT